MYKYLIIECDELHDQWECDANRTPICLTNDYSEYNKRGYEIYEINANGTLKQIRDYNSITETWVCVYLWNDSEKVEEESPDTIIKIKKGDRHNITKSLIKKIKQQYHFSESINEIEIDINCSGSHAEEINNKWVVFGEVFDDFYSYGY